MIRKAYTSAMVSPRAAMESRLFQLCRPGADGVPPRLTRYRSLFERFPRNYREIDTEEKKCILDAAHFLHQITDTVKEMTSAEKLAASERQKLEQMREYVKDVIADFRLKDFRPTKH